MCGMILRCDKSGGQEKGVDKLFKPLSPKRTKAGSFRKGMIDEKKT